MNDFDVEMETAALQLVNYVITHLERHKHLVLLSVLRAWNRRMEMRGSCCVSASFSEHQVKNRELLVLKIKRSIHAD